MKKLIKHIIKNSDVYDKLDKYDIELISINIINELERLYIIKNMTSFEKRNKKRMGNIK